ncbi:MAG: hypothetical protein QOK18_3264 [Mycobacterium sp.]|jgi:hypothetical protein|nr:hypothetical protein [Mycobacterium sp.]
MDHALETALNAFAITFADRMPGSEANPPNEDAAYTVDLTDPARPASSLVLLKWCRSRASAGSKVNRSGAADAGVMALEGTYE